VKVPCTNGALTVFSCVLIVNASASGGIGGYGGNVSDGGHRPELWGNSRVRGARESCDTVTVVLPTTLASTEPHRKGRAWE
jgi:hypothetical protein